MLKRPEAFPAVEVEVEDAGPKTLPWPPPYTLRASRRARYARLRIRPDLGLEIVTPPGMPSAEAPAILEHHRDWICKTLLRVCGKEAFVSLPEAVPAALPEKILLHGGCVILPLSAMEGGVIPALPHWRNGRLLLEGSPLTPTPSAPASLSPLPLPKGGKALPLLLNHLLGYARHYLGARVAELGRTAGLQPSALTIRRQKSRWGSCTSSGKLNLNLGLIFLPLKLCEHVLVHEICHLRHLNHGQDFWKLLFSLEPDALRLDKGLRAAWKYVPAWIWKR